MVAIPVYLDVESRLDARAAEAVARDLTRMFEHVGDDISHGLRSSLSKAFGAVDGSAARREFLMLEQQSRRAADVAEESARREVRALGQVEVARRRANEVTAKYGVESSRAAAANVALVDSHARAAKAQRDHTAAVADAAAAHNAFTNAAEGSTAAVGRFGQAATIASAGIVGGFVAAAVDATKAAGDFQVQLVRLETVGGELPGNLGAIRDGLMDLASKTGWEPTQLATGMLKVEQAGYRNAEALTVMKAAAQAAAEEGVGLDEAANAVTTTLGDYHLKADQAANVTSKMVEAVRLSKTTFAEFTSALHNVEPTAAAVGDSLNDLLSTLGMLTKSGMHPDQASQNLNHALSSLGNIQPKQREMLAALGLDPREIPNDIKSIGYIGTAQQIRSAVDRRLGPNGNVILDAFENNPASQALEHEEYARLSPAERDVADRIMHGQLSYKDFRRSRGGLGFTQAKIVDQWVATHENNQGFNRVLKSLNTDQLGQLQALTTAVGGQDNARTLLQVTDQNNPEAVKHRQEIADAHADPNGDVMEYKRSQQNFNAQWKDLKASVDALKIEFGEDFLPMATKWVHDLEIGVHWMQQHRALVKDLIEDATILSGLFLGMKLSTSLVNTVKEFRKAFGRTKTAVDQTNTSMRESAAAAAAGQAGVNQAAMEEQAAQRRVKAAVDQANQELRAAGNAAQAGASGVAGAAAEDVGAQNRVKAAAAEADAQLRGAGAAAEAGAAGVVAAANTEIGAMNRVMSAANRAKGALAAVGGMALSMGGDALQADTRDNTNPHKLGVIASDAGNMAMAGGAIGSVIPGVGTAIGAVGGGVLGAGYAIWDQYFSGHHDVAAPANPNPDTGPVPVVPDTSAPTPDLTAPVPDTSAPEMPDLPYSGGGGGGGGKKHKDTDPLDQDLKRIERLQTEANEIQARIADDQKSSDPARRGEIPWLQKKLDEINRELAGISGKSKSGSGSPFMPVKLDDNWLRGGLPSLVRNTIGFLEDLVLGPLEVAAFGGVPTFGRAGGKAGRHLQLDRRGLEGPGGPLGGPSDRPTQGVVPVFVTNWAGGPGGIGAPGGGGPGFGGRGSGAPGGGASSAGGSRAAGAPIGPGSRTDGWGLPGGATDSEKWLLSHLAAAGFSAGEIRGILAMNRVESGGRDIGMLGLTQGQVPSRDDKLAMFLRQWRNPQGSGYHGPPGVNGQPPGVDANGNVVDSNRFLDWLSGAVEGQAGLARDWQGNTQPADYRQQVRNQYNQIQPPTAPTAKQSATSSSHHTFYDQWYGDGSSLSNTLLPPSVSGRAVNPKAYGPFRGGDPRPGRPLSDSEILPPEVVAEAQRRGWFGPDGNLKPGAVPSPTAGAAPGSLSNPKSVTPRVKMPQDIAALPGVNMPLPGVRPSPPARPATTDPGLGSLLGAPGYATGGLSDSFPGGPKGTDTIPAWLSPGEEVEQRSAVDKYGPRFMGALNRGLVDPSVVQYFGTGGGTSDITEPNSSQPRPQGAVKMPGPGVKQPEVPGAPKPGQPMPGPKPGGMGANAPHHGISGLAAPGADAQQPGTGLPASPGLGISGGIIGGIEGAASQAAGMAASLGTFGGAGGAVSSAMNIGFEEINRAASYGADVGGILTEGLLESLIPDAGGSSSDWAKTIPGRLLMGVTGMRPAASQNTAGKTQEPFASNASGDKFADGGGNVQPQAPIQIFGPVHVQANDTKQIHSELNEQTNMAANRFGAQQR